MEAWFHAFAATGDPLLRERIILAYLGLADRLAERYRHSPGAGADDLRQIARLGLVAAVDRYQPDRANPFVPYAIACIRGELKRHLRDTTWRLHVTRRVKEQALAVLRALDELPPRLGRSPTIAELAEHVGLGSEEVMDALEAASSRAVASLDQPVGDGNDTVLGALLPEQPASEELEDLLALPGLLAGLPDLERTVIGLYFFQELSQDQIATQLECSQMHVSRVLRRGLARLRGQLVT